MNGKEREERARGSYRLPFWLGLGLIVAIAVFFLWQEHRAHLLGVLPFLLLLACLVLHLFMHRGHGHGAGHEQGHPAGHRGPPPTPGGNT